MKFAASSSLDTMMSRPAARASIVCPMSDRFGSVSERSTYRDGEASPAPVLPGASPVEVGAAPGDRPLEPAGLASVAEVYTGAGQADRSASATRGACLA